jgi:DNA-binding transcriptional regulator GbsR (MarR family)
MKDAKEIGGNKGNQLPDSAVPEGKVEAVEAEPGADPRVAANAGLRDRILLYLWKHKAESVSAIARALESPRPSVSRAVSELQKLNLVVKQGRACGLTPPGETEAQRLEAALPQKAQKVNRSVRSMVQQMRGLRNTTAHLSASAHRTDDLLLPASFSHLKMLRGELEQVVRQSQKRDFMSATLLLKAIDIENWANRLDARSVLPRVVRRLILATVKDVERLHFPADESVQAGGWDGIAVSRGGNEFVPAGTSVWEMGVNSDIKGKADDDYNKRSENALSLDPAETTFVFVTPRSWSQKNKWVKARKAEGKWKDVRVYDADDLEMWLEAAPAVHLWFSMLLGKYPRGAKALEDFWTDWAVKTDPPFVPGLVIGGRSATRESVEKWLRGAPSSFALKGDALDEPLAFLASVIASMEELEREQLLARAVVVEDVASWRELLVSSADLVLVPRFDGEVEGITRAVKNGHHVFAAAAPGTPSIEAMPRIVRDAAEKALEEMGLPRERASDLATLGRRSLWALRRKLASEPTLKTPDWAQPHHARELLAPLLVSTWQEGASADRQVLEKLAGTPYQTLQEQIVRWSRASDPPLRLVGGHWMMVAPEDAWRLLSPFLTADDIARFKKVALDVLGAPSDGTDTHIRWSGLNIGDGEPRISGTLRQGVASTLALCAALSGDVTFACDISGKDVAHSVLWSLFEGARGDFAQWAAFAPVLPLLAEAAPEPFLDAVEAGLRGEAPLMGQMFQTKDNDYGFGPTSPHTYLLWALETLTWNPEFLGRAALALARLVQLDPGARNGNHPDHSLRDIFVLWYPNTTASLERRIQVLDLMRKRTPDVAWNLFLRLLPTGHGDTVSSTHGPEWHDWKPDEERPVTYAEIAQATEAIVARLLDDAGKKATRWCGLLARTGDLWPPQREKLLDRLDALESEILAPEERMKMAGAIRALVTRHQEFADAQWAMPEEHLARLQVVLQHLEPDDLVLRHLWRFERFVRLSERRRELNWEERRKKVAQLRNEALQEIMAAHGFDGVLRLARQAEDPESVGETLGALPAPPVDVDAFFAENLNSAEGWRAAMALAWIRVKAWDGDEEWIRARQEAARGVWTPEQWGEFFRSLPLTVALFDQLDGLEEAAQRHYWTWTQNTGLSNDPAVAERIIARLLWVGRYGELIKNLHWAIQDAPDLVAPERIMEVLEAASVGSSAQELGDTIYDTAELLDHLVGKDAPRERLGMLEWLFFPLHEYTRTPKVLQSELARDPHFFVTVLSWIYRARPGESETDQRDRSESALPEEPVEESEDPQEAQFKADRAHRAWSLLNNWHQIPGIREDGTLDEEHLKSWVARVRDLAREKERAVVTLIHIGHALAHSPRDEDGAWPHRAVRDIIDDIAHPRLESGFSCQVINNRGVTSRGLTDGGAQERVLAEKYERDATQVGDSWPRTASVLRSIARDYHRHAEQEDRSADLTQDLWR